MIEDRYWLFQRASGVFYVEDRRTKKQSSLKTKNEAIAKRLLAARNQAAEQPSLNVAMARSYLLVKNPEMVGRTWKDVMDELEHHYAGPTLQRWKKIVISPPFSLIRNLRLLETESEHFLKVLRHERSGVSTNVQLRTLHNRALALGWLLTPALVRTAWPPVRYKVKRAITWEEHQRIIARELKNEADHENRLFYEMLWETGGSQTDIATLERSHIDAEAGKICYRRKKREGHRDNNAVLLIGKRIASILRQLPPQGFLFPRLSRQSEVVRASKFRKRCVGLGIKGVTLHSYRYAWAERAKNAGMPLREAMAYLGHTSKAVHSAYAEKSEVVTLPLEYYEEAKRKKIVEFNVLNSLEEAL
ncbi:MAG TPA: tyrosine-type recombinase/integrase [Candidatus Methylacidiphilales bacterium]